jgi:hypothetical protein
MSLTKGQTQRDIVALMMSVFSAYGPPGFCPFDSLYRIGHNTVLYIYTCLTPVDGFAPLVRTTTFEKQLHLL